MKRFRRGGAADFLRWLDVIDTQGVRRHPPVKANRHRVHRRRRG